MPLFLYIHAFIEYNKHCTLIMRILNQLIVLSIIAFTIGCKTVQPSSSTTAGQSNESSEISPIAEQRMGDGNWEQELKNQVHIAADDSLIVERTERSPAKTKEAPQKRKEQFSFIGVGDIMLGTNFPNEGYLPPNEGKDMLTAVKDILQSADITFGNQEGVILNQGGQQKNCNNPDVCYLFRSPEYMAQRLVEAGFDMMSLANNHAGDFGDIGRKNTIRVFDSLGIHHAGQESRPYTTFRYEDITIGFAAFAPNVGTVRINDYQQAKAIVQHLDSISDIVIVSFHGGAEGAKYTKVTREREFFVGEDRGNVYEFAHLVIDAGADIVFGHGPHVPRAIEVYKNKFIAYSLGNFATYGRFNLRGNNGLAPIAKIITDRAGNFIEGQIISAIQIGNGVPVPDEEHRAARLIKQLTEEDFPESKIKIDEEGNIRYIQNQL
jgi:poly-gamma-glutamate capsule biosynthesis protein CapA/YwtB (metallophosphatase superfamily)